MMDDTQSVRHIGNFIKKILLYIKLILLRYVINRFHLRRKTGPIRVDINLNSRCLRSQKGFDPLTCHVPKTSMKIRTDVSIVVAPTRSRK